MITPYRAYGVFCPPRSAAVSARSARERRSVRNISALRFSWLPRADTAPLRAVDNFSQTSY